MSKAKELLAKIKAMFDDPNMPAPLPAAPAPPAGKVYTLQDGTTQISIVQSGDDPGVGDMVTINGAPAPANTYTLQDGSTLTTDATGTITAYTPAAPVTVDPMDAGKTPAAPAAPAAPAMPAAPKFELNEKGQFDKSVIDKMLATFATGDPEERINNLEVVCRALMQYCYGWQIKENEQKATTDAAIEVYKTDLVNAQLQLSKQESTITAQNEKMKLMLELIEQIAAAPTADPTTLAPQKKEKFKKQIDAEEKFKKIAASMKQIQTA